MDDVLCNISAWRYWRTPPQVLALCAPVPAKETDRHRKRLKQCDLVCESLGLPLHITTSNPSLRTSNSVIRRHLRHGQLPFGSVCETEHGLQVESPFMAVFGMIGSLSVVGAAMMLYELCGTFSVFEPSKRMEAMLKRAYDEGLLSERYGWSRVKDAAGRGTNLWKRPPLVELDELDRFCKQIEGRWGAQKFREAARMVVGVCASPLEVRTVILLIWSRRKGGFGFSDVETNARISLPGVASQIAQQYVAYADILITSRSGEHQAIIECQGRVVHGRAGAGISDAERATALQSLGYSVIMVTHQQVSNAVQFERIVRTVCRLLDDPYRPKSEHGKGIEAKLRREVFIDWEDLGT